MTEHFIGEYKYKLVTFQPEALHLLPFQVFKYRWQS